MTTEKYYKNITFLFKLNDIKLRCQYNEKTQTIL